MIPTAEKEGKTTKNAHVSFVPADEPVSLVTVARSVAKDVSQGRSTD